MERAKTVFRVIKEYIIKYYVAFFCGGVVWMLLDVYVTKGIDASFVSAIMDSIMAGTAMLAVLAAKNYLAQFTAQEGFKIAISLVNEEVLSIPKYNSVLNHYIILHDKIHQLEGQTIEMRIADELSKKKQDLIRDRRELSKLHFSMVEKKRKLDTYGIDVNEHKTQFYLEMNRNLSMFLNECKDLESKINIMLKVIPVLSEKNLFGYTKTVFHTSMFKFKEPIPNKEIVRKYWLEVINNYDKFRKHERSITKLFKVYG